VSANQCLGIHRDFSQDEQWYCPPCEKEEKLKEKARLENWSVQKLQDSLAHLKKQRDTFALPKREYEDPVPQLRQITDFNTSSSEDEEQEIEEGTITRIGDQFQSQLTDFGKVSSRSNECRKIWDSKRLAKNVVDDYLEQAKRLWESSYLNGLVPFNEQEACKILHVKRYHVQNALHAILHERLPYVVCKKYLVTEHDKIRQEQDIMELRNGYSLSMG
jgi:hypothetical protein